MKSVLDSLETLMKVLDNQIQEPGAGMRSCFEALAGLEAATIALDQNDVKAALNILVGKSDQANLNDSPDTKDRSVDATGPRSVVGPEHSPGGTDVV